MTNRHKGELALFSAALLYGFFGIFSRLIAFNIPFFYQTSVRNIFAIIVTGILVLYLKKWKNVAKKDIKWFLLRGICGFIAFITIFISFTKIDIGTTYFLSFAAAAITGYIVGTFVFREKLDRINIAALILSIAGLLLVYSVNLNGNNGPYLILALASGIASPGWNVFSKKISGTYSNVQLNFIDSILSTLFPLFISIFLRETWVPILLNAVWIETFLFGLMFLTVGFLIVYGFSKVDAQAGTLILLFEVVAGMVLAYFFFQETVAVQSLFGGVLILLAIALRTRKLDHVLNKLKIA